MTQCEILNSKKIPQKFKVRTHAQCETSILSLAAYDRDSRLRFVYDRLLFFAPRMSVNYKLAMQILQKWTPLSPGREFMDYGLHLRQLVLKSFPGKEMFPGTEVSMSFDKIFLYF